MRGTLEANEYHPSALIALQYIKEHMDNVFIIKEALASCAIEGNRLAEVCLETLNRLDRDEPVSDRYIMGLAWFIYESEHQPLDKLKEK